MTSDDLLDGSSHSANRYPSYRRIIFLTIGQMCLLAGMGENASYSVAAGNVQAEPADYYDVVVAGSGAGGMLAAIRAHDLGLSVALVEKAAVYGGTTAASAGGIWVPMNNSIADKDSNALAMTYLRAVTQEKLRDNMLQTYVANARPVTDYLAGLDVHFSAGIGYPDYFSELPGALRGRSMLPLDRDGGMLGGHFKTLRDGHPSTLLLGRYALNPGIAAVLGARLPGWKKALARLLWDYWSDVRWRFKTAKDRRLTMGRSVIGGLRKAMADRGIPLFLNTPLIGLDRDGDRIAAVRIKRNGKIVRVKVRGVILASGGFEKSQPMRDRFLVVSTQTGDSAAPDAPNTGDAISLGEDVSAAMEHMGHAWWCPVMVTPSGGRNGKPVSHPLFFDRAKPGTISVNRLGHRFVNESVSYDLFGYGMVADQLATGANNPCWMIFDSRFRGKYPAGGLLPSWAMPDRAVPGAWWDNVVFRADDLVALAGKIGVPAKQLCETVSSVNRQAETGVDDAFGRGQTGFERAIGDPSVRPNPSFGPIDKPPYYAIRVNLGDLGTRGGLKIDEDGAVLDQAGQRIPGLYATGDASASIFGDTYPGGGCAIGPAMVFGYLAASEIAAR